MPQASLLSYFSKPVTSSASLPPDQAHNDTERDDPVVNNEFDVSATASPSKGLGIIEAIRLQATEESPITRPRAVEDATRETTSIGSNVTEKSSKPENLEARLVAPCDGAISPSQVIKITHLPECVISPVLEAHLPSIRRLTSTTLPVRYGDAFFDTTVTDPVAHDLCRVVLYASEPVGWIRCRLEPCSPNSALSSSRQAHSQIYIQALALLSPYRGLGLASMLLDAILSSTVARFEQTVCMYAHVWEKNEDALEWYAKRGFKRVMLVERYYRKLRPGGAWIVRRELDHT